MASKKILIDIQISDGKASQVVNKTKGSVDALASATKKLNNLQKQEAIDLEVLNQRIKIQKEVNVAAAKSTLEMGAATRSATGAMIKGKATSGLNNAILQESSRLASDAAYGFQGMANNLGQLVSLFQISANNAGGFANTIKELGKSLLGTGGILIAVQLLISFLPNIQKWFKKSRQAADEFGGAFDDLKSSVDDTSSRFETYISTIQSSTKSDEQKEIAVKRLNKEFPDYIKNLDDASLSLDDVKNATDDAAILNDKYRESIIQLAITQAAQNKIQEISSGIVEKQGENKLALMNLGLDENELNEKFNSIQDKRTALLEKGVFMILTDRQKSIESAKAKIDVNNEFIKSEEKRRDVFFEFIKLEDLADKKNKSSREAKNRYDKIRVESYNKEISLVRELGRIRESFAQAERNILLDNIRDNQTVIELDRKAALNEVDLLVSRGASEEQAAIARFQINSFYNKLSADDAIENQKRADASRMEMFSNYASALGSISKLIGENTKVGKIAALAEIAANTAIGFQKGLIVAQEQSLAGGPFSAIAFPAFYAAQIAAVLSGAAKAKSILSGGSSGGSSGSGGSGGGAAVQAPDFNVVGASETSQLGMALASTQKDSEIKLYWSDIDDMNKTNERNESIVGFG